MRMLRLLSLSVVALTLASSGVAATVIPVGEFRSVALNDGGHVIVRHGAVQRVSFLNGDARCTRVRVAEGQRLVIDNSGRRQCPRGYRLQVEVVTPHLSSVSVSNGGSVQTFGAFPAQESLAVAVEQGGTIDARSIAADSVAAAVDSGGRIFTTSRKTLTAAVRSGGGITYWGSVRDVTKSVHDGGVVTRGAADDADKPLSEFAPGMPAIPPLPPLPTIPPLRN